MHKLFTVIATASLLVLTLPATSRACWDGAMVTTDRVTLATSTYGDAWNRSFTRHAATWTARLEVVLPDEVNLTVDHGWVEAWGAGGNEAWGRREARHRVRGFRPSPLNPL